MMKVAIVHYHLKKGGVTSVILNTLLSCSSEIKFLILVGERPEFPVSSKWIEIPGLAYEDKRPDISVSDLVSQMEQACKDFFGTLPDLWHFHNHCLGKNLLVPKVVWKLAQKGCPLLLQVHDFPEDGRANNYQSMLDKIGENKRELLAKFLYPIGEHIHYALLNQRDVYFLQRAGAPEKNVHFLPNPVAFNSFTTRPKKEIFPNKRFWLYPTRAIRRKNIGEFIFWAIIYQDDIFATTRVPENPRFWPFFLRWKKFVHTNNIKNVYFELAAKYGFENVLNSADVLLTTSVSEGFGLVFLEPWLKNKPLAGRDLPEITLDFKQKGVFLENLYQRLDIPLEWLDYNLIWEKLQNGLQYSFRAYGLTPKKDDFDLTWSSWVKDNKIDFGCLDEDLQEHVLKNILKDKTNRRLFSLELRQDKIEENKRYIEKKFGYLSYKKRLCTIYNKVGLSSASSLSSLDGMVLLKLFLSPQRFKLLTIH
ncbi:hypothetical protein [Desulfonauticus submarinus]